jgi:hypothetical protein
MVRRSIGIRRRAVYNSAITASYPPSPASGESGLVCFIVERDDRSAALTTKGSIRRAFAFHAHRSRFFVTHHAKQSASFDGIPGTFFTTQYLIVGSSSNLATPLHKVT